MSLVTNNGFNEFQNCFQQILSKAKEDSIPAQQDADPALLEKTELRQCIGSMFQKIELFKQKSGERLSLNGDNNLFVQLGKRDEYIAKQISIIKKVPLAIKSIGGMAIGGYALDVMFFPKTYGIGESDFPEGDPILMMSWQEKIIFVGAVLIGSIVAIKMTSIIKKWHKNIYLQHQIRNDPQFADFVKYFQLSFTNVKEAKKICDIFDEFKWLNEDLNRLQKFEKINPDRIS